MNFVFANPQTDLKATNILCYYCCHKFKSKPLHMPHSYNEKTNTFKVFGVYCSWNCMKTHNNEMQDSKTNYRNNLIYLLRSKMTKDYNSIQNAPSRYNLKAFGGKMSIEEFRAKSKTSIENILYPPMIPINPLLDKNINFTYVESNEAESYYETFSTPIENNPLKMKRTKAKKNEQNTLEQSMGLKP